MERDLYNNPEYISHPISGFRCLYYIRIPIQYFPYYEEYLTFRCDVRPKIQIYQIDNYALEYIHYKDKNKGKAIKLL